MGVVTATIATLAAVASTVGAVQGYEARKDAQKANKAAANEQRKVQGEQKALNFQAQAEERRKQVREERVRRAKLLQASNNTGGAGSSGELGAVGSLATQLNANIGINLGKAAAGNRISGYLQNAADFNTASQNAMMDAQNGDALFGVGMNIFNAAGGVNAFKTPKG